MARAKALSCMILYLVFLTSAQYNDDSDYDLVLYDDFPMDYGQGIRNDALEYDDFYILAELDEPKTSNTAMTDERSPSELSAYEGGAYNEKEINFDQLEGHPVAKKVYRYTKHRMPGYDYEELDYLAARSFHRCDEKSVWTHCLCQFTCSDPDTVDCYTPCKSGCECKENYVFDEKSQTCVLPEKCPDQLSKENSVYKK